MHQFFVEADKGVLRFSPEDIHHITHVLRMTDGEEIMAVTGEGKRYLCRLSFIEGRPCAEILREVGEGAELLMKVVLYQGLPKADKLEWLLQKNVELGLYALRPVLMDRCVVRWEAKKEDAKLSRLSAISESAAKQSRRDIVPEVLPLMDFPEALAYAKTRGPVLFPYEGAMGMEESRACLLGLAERVRTGKEPLEVGIFIGPEGGFSEREVDMAKEAGCHIITLGPRILRTETAGMAIMALLMLLTTS